MVFYSVVNDVHLHYHVYSSVYHPVMVIHAVFLIISHLLFSVGLDDCFVFDTSDDVTSAVSVYYAVVSVYIPVYLLKWFRFI